MIKAACVFILNNSGQILLLKRAANDCWMAGKWGLPGGKLDKGEQFEQAAIRESKEETGLSICEPKLVHILKNTKYDVKYFTVGSWFGKIILDPVEHSDYQWIAPRDINPDECTPNLRTLAIAHAS